MSETEAVATATDAVLPLSRLRVTDADLAGGKGANLGELINAGFSVPGGFAVSAPAYAAFVDDSGLRGRLEELLAGLDPDDSERLRALASEAAEMIASEPVPGWLADQIAEAYAALEPEAEDTPVAVRSSATAEDSGDASFAGMNETFLNVVGLEGVIDSIRACWASLFGPRTIFYRAKRGYPITRIDIAVIVQSQIPSAKAGVMFTVDPASGSDQRLVIEGSFGLGEAVVSGSVSPDRYLVDTEHMTIEAREVRRKERVIEHLADGGTRERELEGREGKETVLSDDRVLELAEIGKRIEEHYGRPQDIEWAIDPKHGLHILQSRPLTAIAASPRPDGEVLAEGLGAAPGSASGTVRVIESLDQASELSQGEVLVTKMTAPDWVSYMRRAGAIVTDSGGMTCHAAIVSRELGIPCVVGTGDGTRKLRDGEPVTVDAGKGVVLAGERAPEAAPAPAAAAAAPAPAAVTATSVLLNLSEPSQLERAADLPVDGVGLLRAELMALEALEQVHPRAVLERGGEEGFVERMADGVASFLDAFSPRPVTYRTLDFRSNEFARLDGGEAYEPSEANPMIGYRGAARYVSEPDLFALELRAVRTALERSPGAKLHLMLPFVRTREELRRCRELMLADGVLDRPDCELWVMAEVPSVLFNLQRYRELGVAGISIGSNDLTQLVLGVDRDSEVLADTFDERDPAVTGYIERLLSDARALGLSTSICGQAPSVHPEYAELLVRAGIDAISVNIDSVDETLRNVAVAERRMMLEAARDSGGGVPAP